jgi:hypothetical protein
VSSQPAPFPRWRLFLTVWLVYTLFATTNVVRETYLAIALGGSGTVRVDPYLGLHPDLFEIPGRGSYINSNPGASMVGAVPYALIVRPVIALATRLRPEIAEPKPPAAYDDPRPNRTRFMNAARARGLDIILGLAALGTAATVMAPLGAMAAVLVALFLRSRLDDDRQALVLALIFAFATPTWFRAAFLNQNAMVAHLVLGAWILKLGLTPRPPGAAPSASNLAVMGLLMGFAVVVDYSAIPFILVFGLWILTEAWRRAGAVTALREGSMYSAGVLVGVSLLFAYQWTAFGHPVWPAQRYMPPTEYSVRGWLGFAAPTRELLWGNLFDLRYGLFTFCPLLLAAFAAPFVRGRLRAWSPTMAELGWIAAAFVGLLVFSSANQFANLQWNTGVRYMVPLVPLLFLAAVPVLAVLPRGVRWALVGVSAALTLAVAMYREDVPTSLRLVADDGPTLPVLLVLQKMASGYDVGLPPGAFWIVVALVSLVLTLIWRPYFRTRFPQASRGDWQRQLPTR